MSVLKVPKTKSTRVQLPYAETADEPARAEPGTLSFDPTSDTVRVQTSTGWEDVGGGGGTVTEVDAGTGIAVANPTGPIVTVSADLAAGSGITLSGTHPQTIAANPASITLAGQVTGPANANKVVGITETTGPTALTIGSIPDPSFLQRSGSAIIGTAVTPIMTGNPFIDPPATPGTYDDEFESGSADLAVRGWTCVNDASATMSRVGDVLPWDVTGSGLSVTQYRSTIFGSQIMIQLSTGGAMRLQKSAPSGFGSGSGFMLWARGGMPTYSQTSATTAYSFTVNIGYDSGGNFDGNNYVWSQVYTVGTTATYRLVTGSLTAGVQTASTTKDSFSATPDIFGLKLKSSTNAWSAFSADSRTGTLIAADVTALTSTTMRWAGIRIADGAAGSGAPNSYVSRIYSLDFIRSATGSSAWIGQTPRTVYGGTAGGDLSGTLPNPNVAAIHETSGPTKLTIGSVSNGELLRRVSGTLVGVGAGSLNIAGQVTGTLATTVVVAVTETSGPTALTIGSVSDGFTVIRKGATLVGSGSTLNPYITAPASPNAFDDEFDSGSADLATRGWSVVNAGTAVTCTRTGNIVPGNATSGIAANTYLSTIVNGKLRIQSATGLLITKALSGSICLASDIVITRSFNPTIATLWYSNVVSGNANVNATTAAILVGEQNGNILAFKQVPPTPTFTNIYNQSLSASIPTVPASNHILDWNGTTFTGGFIANNTGRIWNIGTTTITMTPVSAGFQINVSTANTFCWAEIGYIRAYPQGTWFPA